MNRSNHFFDTEAGQIVSRALPYLTLVAGALFGIVATTAINRRDPNFRRAREEGIEQGRIRGREEVLSVVRTMNPAPQAQPATSVNLISPR